jgi:hypothetical protein
VKVVRKADLEVRRMEERPESETRPWRAVSFRGFKGNIVREE